MKKIHFRITSALLFAFMIGLSACNKDDNEAGTWTQMNTNLQSEVRSLQFVSDDVGYAKVIGFGGWGFKLTKTTDGGLSWIDIPFPVNQDEYPVLDFSFQNADTGYVILPDHLRTTFDGGASWDSVYIDDLVPLQLIATSAGKVYFTAIGLDNVIKLFETEDHFQTWSHLYDFPDGIVGEYKYLSTDNAAFFAFNNWEGQKAYLFKVYNDVVDELYFPAPAENKPTRVFITALFFNNKDAGFFVLSESDNTGRSNIIYKTVDFSGYETMASIPDGTAGGQCLYFKTTTDGWVGTGNGQIYKVSGSKLSLEFQNIQEHTVVCFSHANSGSNLYFGGTGGTMGKYILNF